jgi:O-antigen/teichoic acid export membrane protein
MLDKLSSNNLELFRGSSIAFIIKIIGTGLTFTFHLIVARTLGADKTGLFFLSLTFITIASSLGRVGLDNTIVRFIAANKILVKWKEVKGIYQKSMKIALIASLIMTAFLISFAPWLSNKFFSNNELSVIIAIMSFSVLPLSISTLHARALQGLKNIRDSVIIDSCLIPLFSVVGVLILVPLFGIQGAAGAYVIANICTLLIGILVWNVSTPVLKKVKGNFNTNLLMKSSKPLFWMTVLSLIIAWSSSILLGVWSSTEDVGVFNIASRIGALTSFIMLSVNSIVAPKFSELYNKKDFKNLKSTAHNAASLMSLLALPLLFLFLFFPGRILSIFGPGFSEGALVLSILAVGQYINVLTGSVSYLLMMCGYEKLFRNIIALSAVISIAMNCILVPKFGILGAAYATSLTSIIQNIVSVFMAWKKLGIITIPMSIRPKNILTKGFG